MVACLTRRKRCRAPCRPSQPRCTWLRCGGNGCSTDGARKTHSLSLSASTICCAVYHALVFLPSNINSQYLQEIRTSELGARMCVSRYVNVSSSRSADWTSTATGLIANPARGQLNRKKMSVPCPRSRLRIWSRETGSAVPSRVNLLILHTQAESSAYSRNPLTAQLFATTASIYNTVNRHRVDSEFIGSHNCAPMAFSPRVRRYTMDQLICAFLSHTHY